MNPEALSIILAIVGTFISLGLALNAYFVKQLVDTIYSVKTAIAVIETKYMNLEKRVDTGENNQKDIFFRLHKVETKDKKI